MEGASVPPERNRRTYIIREIVELVAIITGLAIAARWLRIPLWVWIVLPLGKALLSAAFYELFLKQTLQRAPRVGPEALIGATARTITPLAPSGRVVIRGESWPAISSEGTTIEPEQEVTIMAVRGNTLLVDFLLRTGSSALFSCSQPSLRRTEESGDSQLSSAGAESSIEPTPRRLCRTAKPSSRS